MKTKRRTHFPALPAPAWPSPQAAPKGVCRREKAADCGDGVYARLSRLVRAGEWWEHKIVPILCGYYATALMLDRPLTEGWSALLLFLVSLVPGAAYVSV